MASVENEGLDRFTRGGPQRMTIAIYADYSIDEVLPELGAQLKSWNVAQNLDGTTARVRMEIGRLEIDNVVAQQQLSVWELVQRLGPRLIAQTAVKSGLPADTFDVSFEWVANIERPRSMPTISGTAVSVRCPKCDGPMDRRRPRKGGSQFWGCSRYPACDGVRWQADEGV